VRKINKVPVKVLDAPSLQDDYYLNLLDWGCQNHLAVGLNSSVYLWNASNSKVLKLCDLGNPLVTGVGWSQKESLLAVGG
jgi:cell division cycle 20-like protein 1 (cofactor of APC complex)